MEFYTYDCPVCGELFDIEDQDRCQCLKTISIDESAVENFAKEMKRKLADARQKGRSGWNNKETCTDTNLAELFWEHMKKTNEGNFVDLANFLMFLHTRKADNGVLQKTMSTPHTPNNYKKRIYLCSPYVGNGACTGGLSLEDRIARNVSYAKRMMKRFLEAGHTVFAPHLLYTQVLDENTQRQIGLDAGLAFLEVCDVVVVCADFGVSEGMKAELLHAKKKVPVINISGHCPRCFSASLRARDFILEFNVCQTCNYTWEV